jgi:hypothetical protein
MRKVTIEYQPFRWFKYTRFVKGNFPSDWSETSPKQLIAIASLLKQSISDVHFLSIMTGLSKRTINKLDAWQRFQLIELFDSFRSNQPYNEFIIPKLDCKGTVLCAPKPKLKGVTFGQFIFLDTYFGNYQQSRDKTDLNKFIASAYLPFGQQFTEPLIDAHHQWVAKTELLSREAIVINYYLIRDWLCEVYPLVFQRKTEQQIKEDETKIRNNIPLKNRDQNSWIKVFESLVGDDIINGDNYANLPLHNVLQYLTSQIKKNLKQK